MSVAANIIWILHMLLVVWVIVTPFTQNEPMLVLHLIMMPFLWFHWCVNDDTCALTLLEQKLRGLSPEECKEKSFFFNLVSPVYKIQDNEVRTVAWIASVTLWLVTLSKVLKRPAMIKDMFLNAKRAAQGEPPIMSPSESGQQPSQQSQQPGQPTPQPDIEQGIAVTPIEARSG